MKRRGFLHRLLSAPFAARASAQLPAVKTVEQVRDSHLVIMPLIHSQHILDAGWLCSGWLGPTSIPPSTHPAVTTLPARSPAIEDTLPIPVQDEDEDDDD